MDRSRNTEALRRALNWMTGGGAAAAIGAERAGPASGRKPLLWIGQVGVLLAITAGSIFLALNGTWVERFGQWGYAGSFLISLISNATVILPAPGLLVVFALGANLNPVLLGVIAGCGSGLGELSGYLIGATGGELVRQRGLPKRLHDLTARYTVPVLFVLSVLPTPFFDVAGILAGAMRFPVYQFLAPVISGKIIKNTLMALAGAWSIQWIQSFYGF